MEKRFGRADRPPSLHTGDSSIRNVTHFTFIRVVRETEHAPWLGLREGGGARACNLHIVLKAECMCSYELPCEACASHGRVKA